jgi:hypothetical protein
MGDEHTALMEDEDIISKAGWGFRMGAGRMSFERRRIADWQRDGGWMLDVGSEERRIGGRIGESDDGDGVRG